MDTTTTGGSGRSNGTRLAIVAVAALGAGLLAGPALASMSPTRPYAAPVNAAPSDTTPPEHLITVGGEGKVTVTPDIAHVQLGVQIQRPTAKAARDAAATSMTTVVDALKNLGVADKDIQTTQVSLSPVYNYPANAAPQLRGYQLTNEVAVTVRDLSKLSDVLDGAVAAGASTVDGVSFDVADRTALEAQARDAAAKDARAKADVYAKSLSLAITGVASVSEQVNAPVWYAPMAMASGAATDKAAAPTPVQPGSTDVTITVQVSFLIG